MAPSDTQPSNSLQKPKLCRRFELAKDLHHKCHGRHDMESLRLNTCFCQLSWKPRVNERSGRGIEDQHGVDLQGPSQTFHRAMVSMTNLVWADFLSEHLQYHVTPQGSTLAQPSKGLQK